MDERAFLAFDADNAGIAREIDRVGEQQPERRRLDGIFLDGPQVGILDGEGLPVGHDAQRARRRVVEPDLARPLHIEAPRGALVGGIDLLEVALQVGDAVEIGVDALDGLGLRLADQRRGGLRRLDGGIPARALVVAVGVIHRPAPARRSLRSHRQAKV